MDRSSKGGWRDKGGQRRRKQPAKPSAKSSRREQPEDASAAWKRGRTRRSDTAGATRTLGFFLLALVLIVLIGVFIWYSFRRVKKTPLAVLTVTSYAAPIPPNAYAREDANRIVGVNVKNLKLSTVAPSGHLGKDSLLEAVRTQLATERPGGPGKDVAILYVSAHGVVDEANRPCLLCSDAESLDSTTWLPIDELLETIKQEQAKWNQGERKVVLLLDANRIDDSWSLGVLYNGFAQRLAEVATTVAVDDLYIINAAGPGQIAWPAPELDGSVFGFYAAKGLAGEASAGDRRISLLELFHYLDGHVAQWALDDRDAVQRPQLIPTIGAEQDFAIAFAGTDPVPNPDSERVSQLRRHVTGLFDELWPLWASHDEAVRQRHAQQTDPLRLAVVQRKLMRAEQLAMAGEAYGSEFKATIGQAAAELQPLGVAPATADVRVFSLPLLQQRGAKEVAATTDAAAILRQWRAAGGRPKPKEGEPVPPTPDYVTAAQVASSWVTEAKRADRALLNDLADYIEASSPRTGRLLDRGTGARGGAMPDVVEVEFLQMLASYLDWDGLSDSRSGDLPRVLADAMEARRLSEVAAAPRDQRVHYFVQPLVDATDQRRRLAEDRLFIGDASSFEQAAGELQGLVGSGGQGGDLQAAVERARTVSDYFAARDAVWSELPYLLHWLVGQLQIGSTDEIGQDLSELVDAALLLIRRNQDLASELELALDGPLNDLPPSIAEAYQEVTSLHEQVRTAYWNYCKYLGNRAGSDMPALRKIGAALRTPLPEVSQRRDLASMYLGLVFLHGGLGTREGVEDRDESIPLPDDSEAVQDYLKRLAAWEVHPAVATLTRAKLDLLVAERKEKPAARAAGDSDLEWLARQGGQVRELQADLLVAANELEAVTTSRLEKTEESAANTRAGLSQADRLTRAAAPFMFQRVWADAAKDPAHRLRVVDRYFQMLWHCRRVLDDFWGAASDAKGEPYFAVVAGQYMQSARALIGLARSPRHGSEDLGRLLQDRLDGVVRLGLTPEDVLTLRDEPSEFQPIDVRWSNDIPWGEAAVFVEREESRQEASTGELVPVLDEAGVNRVRRHAVRLAPGSLQLTVKQRLRIDQTEQVDAITPMRTTLYYRGHVKHAAFQVIGPTYVSYVEVQPVKRSAAKVRVEGDAKRRGHVMFIYDCSLSMNKRQKNVTAQQAFEAVLRTLREAKNYEVGLRAYGRRAGFVEGQPASVRRYADEQAEKDQVHPDKDVERLIPLRYLDDMAFGEFEQQLPRLQPWGQTPLYFAITECYREHDFLRAKKEDAKHIIVITDGVNYQSDPKVKGTSKQDVLDLREKMPQYADVRIDIIGLDTEGEDEAKLEEFSELSKATGGQYYEAKDTASLEEAFRDALQLAKFRVVPFGKTSDADSLQFKLDWPVTAIDPLQPDYQVQIVGIDDPPQASIKLEGGEAVGLFYRESLRSLEFPRFESQRTRGEAIEAVDPKTQRRYVIQAMLAERHVNDVEFQVYIQDQDKLRFTERPKHVWAEITTKGVQPEQTYYFADADFVEDEPVPIFRFLAKDWPKSAKSALIQFWCQFDKQGVAPDGFLKVNLLTPTSLKLPSLPGIRFEVDTDPLPGGGYRVNVTERHDVDVRPDRVRVRISPEPYQGIGHRYYAGVEIVKHEFDFPRQTPASLEITGSKRLKAESLHATLQDIPVE